MRARDKSVKRENARDNATHGDMQVRKNTDAMMGARLPHILLCVNVDFEKSARTIRKVN